MATSTHQPSASTPPERLPATAAAAVREHYGPPATIRVEQLPLPTPGKGQVLLRVLAAGIDRGAWHLLTGEPFLVRVAGYGLRRPKQPRLGLDVAGTVVGLGPDAHGFAIGDEVFGIADGSWAEYAVADVTRLAHRPPNVDPVQAGAAAVSGITALQALVDIADVQPGQRVLVVGASGGVGSFAVQIAAAHGATVDGVASAAKADLVRSLGATTVFDHRTDDVYDGANRYDIIVDTGGRNPVRTLRRALTERGTLVIVGGEGGGAVTGGVGRQARAAVRSLFTRQRMVMFVSAEDRGHIAKLAHYLADGRVTTAVGSTHPLAEAAAAVEELVAGRVRGKAALIVAPAQQEREAGA